MEEKISRVRFVTLIISLVILPIAFIVWVFMAQRSADPSIENLSMQDSYLPSGFWSIAAIVAFLILFGLSIFRKSK